jgi:hypothetical protein
MGGERRTWRSIASAVAAEVRQRPWQSAGLAVVVLLVILIAVIGSEILVPLIAALLFLLAVVGAREERRRRGRRAGPSHTVDTGADAPDLETHPDREDDRG